MRLIIRLCAIALLAVCASQPASADEPVAPSATAPTATAGEPQAETGSVPAAAAEAQPVAAPVEAQPAAAHAEEKPVAAKTETEVTQSSIDRKVAEAKKEYMQVDKDGQTLFCRREPKLGTRLPQYLCLTEAELINRVRSNEDLVDRQRLPKPCTAGACSGG